VALHFEKSPTDYKRHRPTYPDALFGYLASLAPAHDRAWDCGTGNGQAALGLARVFRRVVATDASAKQLGEATPHPRVEYRVVPAETSGLDDLSVDLVTVAQALHWFDLERFYREAERVARPGGVLAAWCYTLIRVTPEIDRVIERFYEEVVGPYWPKERVHVETAYRDLPFPFAALPSPPPLAMELEWDFDEVVGYVRTWSPVKIFADERGYDPVGVLGPALEAAWGLRETRRAVRWPLHFRIGRVRPVRAAATAAR
jgi:ubiquinone/menaquinone biosynthesis C-methylase UbiE